MIFGHFDVVECCDEELTLHLVKNFPGFDTGRLECCLVQRYGKD